MTPEEIEKIKAYKDYPEGSGSKRYYDSVFLPFEEYLEKYYSSPDLETWERFKTRYVEPAFEEERYEEMIKNFGYVSIDKHNFEAQYEIYNQLKNNDRLDDETKKFIGFMAGNGFFNKRYNISLEQWFNARNWGNLNIESEDGRTINELLTYNYGLNYCKVNLPHMNYWRR